MYKASSHSLAALPLIALFFHAAAFGQCDLKKYKAVQAGTAPTKVLKNGKYIRELPDLSTYVTNADPKKMPHVAKHGGGGQCPAKDVIPACSSLQIEENSANPNTLLMTLSDITTSNPTVYAKSVVTPIPSPTQVDVLVSNPVPMGGTLGDITFLIYLLDEDFNHPGNYGGHKAKIAKQYYVEAYDKDCVEHAPTAKDFEAQSKGTSSEARIFQTDTGQGHEGKN